MNPETIKAVQDALTPLAGKLGQGAGQLFEICTRQQLVEGVVGLIESLVLLAVLYGIYHFGLKLWRGRKRYEEEDAPWQLLLIGTAIFFVFLIFCIDNTVTDSLGKLANPQYYALQAIVKDVRGK